MKVYKFFPILAIALLIPSFAEARHDDRGQSRQYSERDHDRYPQNPVSYRRQGYDRDYNRGYDRGRQRKTTYRRRLPRHRDDHYYCDHPSHDRYGHSRRGGHRRGRRGVHFGGVIVIRF